MTALVDDVPKAVLATLVTVLAVLGLWALLDRRTAAGAWLRGAWRRHHHLVVLLLAAAVLVAVAEDVLEHEHDELVLRLDLAVQAAVRSVAGDPAVHHAAALVSRLTGAGLAAAVGVVALAFVALGRASDAWTLLWGSGSAWLISGVLKVAWHIPRPRAVLPWKLSSFGFPSGHALVTLVACGLIAWALGRGLPRPARATLMVMAASAAVLAGASRIALNAHWPSDVVAGLAIGTLWLYLVVAVGARRRAAGSLS